MSWQVAAYAACGAGIGLGLWLLITPGPPARPRARLLARAWSGQLRQRATVRVVAAVAVAAVVGAVTGWPAAAVLAALAVWALPGMLGPDTEHTRRVARIEAIATWAEMLRDTLSAAAGLQQAIVATASAAPEPIRGQVDDLAARLRAGQRLPEALRRFADALADPTGDLVVAALILAAERQARHLADLLGSLATAAREQVAMRLRTGASRARVRTSVRVITGVTIAMAAGLVVLNRGYLAPYDTALGQLVLLAVGAIFAASLAWLSRIARLDELPRLLVNAEQTTSAQAREGGGA